MHSPNLLRDLEFVVNVGLHLTGGGVDALVGCVHCAMRVIPHCPGWSSKLELEVRSDRVVYYITEPY